MDAPTNSWFFSSLVHVSELVASLRKLRLSKIVFSEAKNTLKMFIGVLLCQEKVVYFCSFYLVSLIL